jgi:hypothetical protein
LNGGGPSISRRSASSGFFIAFSSSRGSGAHLPRTGDVVDALGYSRNKAGFASVSRSLGCAKQAKYPRITPARGGTEPGIVSPKLITLIGASMQPQPSATLEAHEPIQAFGT